MRYALASACYDDSPMIFNVRLIKHLRFQNRQSVLTAGYKRQDSEYQISYVQVIGFDLGL